MDLFRKRTADYSDYAYREAVSKLKYLLAESYTPITVHKFSPGGPLYKFPYHSSYEHLPTSDTSYIPTHSKSSRALLPPKRPDYTSSVPPEFTSYMRKQEDYIGHLEKESQSCRDELSKMLEKVREVIAENEKLRDARKTLNGSGIDSEDESEIDEKEKKKCCKHSHSAPNIVFESRISELEAQLTQCRIELRKAQEEAAKTQSRAVDTTCHYPADSNKQVEALQREREELNDTINNLQLLVSQLREKESSATQKVKRSLDLVDQAHFDKNQVIDALEMEVRRLKSELERMNDKQREAIQDSARRVNEAERRYAMQIERLNSDLATQWDAANRLNLELDRSRRTEQELRRDLAQKNSTIEELKKELMTKTSNLQTEALTIGAERETLESELATSRLAIERAERNGRQETVRLQAEVASLRQRLDRADADLLHTRKENLRLTDTVASLEKEVELAKMAKESSKDPKRNDELANMIKEMDAKHVQSVAELEGMIQSQTQLMEKLKNECQMLTERLEDSSARHKEDKNYLMAENEALLLRLTEMWTNCKELLRVTEGLSQEQQNPLFISTYTSDCVSVEFPGPTLYPPIYEEDFNDKEEEMAGLQSNIEYLNSKLEAPVNYENQEWRDDGMVNEYQDDPSQYEGGDGQKNGTHYDQTNEGGYNQNGGYQGEGEVYAGDQAYTGQEGSYANDGAIYSGDGTGYPPDASGYPTNAEGYPTEEGVYSENSAYPPDATNYQGEDVDYQKDDQNYAADPSTYPTSTNGYPADSTAYSTDPSAYPADTEAYPVDSNAYPPDSSTYPGDNTSFPAEDSNYAHDGVSYTEPPQQQQPPLEPQTQPQPPVIPSTQNIQEAATVAPVYGVDTSGGGIVAQQEQYIP